MKALIQNGKCQYTILVPKNGNAHIRFAAQELAYAIEKSCGNSPSIVLDGELAVGKTIQLGNTQQAKREKLKPHLSETGMDGFKILVRGENVFIIAATSEGVIYGVYEFLNRTLGTKFFGYDEYVIPKHTDVNLPELDIVKRPDIETRVREMDYTIYDVETERRLGFNASVGRNWVTWAHTHFQLMPKEKYWFTNRDFYSPDGRQLCLSNSQLVGEMVKNVVALLTPQAFEKSDVLFVMVGHEDNPSFCNCPACEENKKKYGGCSGVMMRFINAVADGVNEYVEKHYPDKVVKIITFGYGLTLPAPVSEDENGNFSIVDKSVIAHKNVGVMLAPLGSDWAHSLVDKQYNEKTRAALRGWQAVKAELFIWTYDGVFDDSFIYIDNFKYLAESYQIFKACGATYLYDEGHQERGFPFLDMRNYIRAKLMWDLSLNVDELVEEFMNGYYKEAATALWQYYKNLRAHFIEVEKEFERKNIPYTQKAFVRAQWYYREKEFWDKDFLEENIRLLEDCRKTLQDTGWTGSLNRLEIEMLSPIYLLLEIFGQDLSNERVEYYSDFFERVCKRNCIYYFGEHGSVDARHLTKKYTVWRSLLLRKEK
ncbi:MAG: DUF4838 domain-containing protein [Clostridia bacterium]|nr:DUF4838 domain-containing protein [Clostridia bacterium]